MRFISALPIHKQMLFLGVFPALLMFFFLSSYFVFERLADVEKELEVRGGLIAKQLAPVSEYSVISGNITVLKQIISPLLDNHEVLYITITDSNNQVLLHSYGEAKKAAGERATKVGDILLFTEKIIQQSLDVEDLNFDFDNTSKNIHADETVKVLGEVLVAMSTIEVKNRQREIMLASSLPAGVALVVTIILALTIGAITAAPIIRLSQVARQIKHGDYTARVEEKMGGEIGSLEVDINEMAAVLQSLEVSQKNLMGKMRVAREQAESASRAKSDFLAMMSHELRTPMNGVLGMLQLMEVSNLTKEQEEYADIAIESTNHLLEVINDILDFSRIERGKLEVESVYFDLKELINKCVRTLSYEIKKKGLEFDLDYQGDFNLIQIKSDPTRLRQILVNLLSNAVKFTEEGSVTLRVILTERADSQVKLILEVEDTGTGIPEDKLEKIFSPFLQADTSTSRQYGGTGLGLSIARQLTELLNGVMIVTSEENVGSRFVCEFTLPYCMTSEFTSDYDKTHVDVLDNKTYGKALVVEDNSINQMVALEMLRLYGVEVEAADDGVVACEKYRNNEYEYIFMDLQMPRMDGMEATRVIRQIEADTGRRHTPIIALTANALQGEKERCLDVGMNDYLAKPFQQYELKEKLDIWHLEHYTL